MSLWSDYVYETRGIDSVENEKGFATFILKDKECYVEDVYIKPEFRRQSEATFIIDKIKDQARRAGCTFLTTTVNLSFADPTGSVKAILSYGFKISHALNGIICFKMEI